MSDDFLDKFAKIPGDRPAGIDELEKILKAERQQAGKTADPEAKKMTRPRYRKPRPGGPVTVFSVRISWATRQAIEGYAERHRLTLGEAVERLVFEGTGEAPQT